MRNSPLRELLESFVADSALHLSADTAGGAEVPFEVIEEPGARSPLYCYRPLTSVFIRERLGRLGSLPSYAPAARALESLDGVEEYLRSRGEARLPAEPRERADAALRTFLNHVFADRSDFCFEEGRFDAAFTELERSLFDGRCVATVIAPLLGVALDVSSTEIALGDGLSLVRGDELPDAPGDAVWGYSEVPNVLAVLMLAQEREERPPVSVARRRFRRLLTALRLFERGGFALGPIAWTRSDDGPWRTVPLGGSGRPRFTTTIPEMHEDELRAFCNLVARRSPTGGEIAWALSRFEMGCERLAPFEALTDYLLGLRALLEPEGAASGRLAQRLAAMCAEPLDRPALAERTAHAISLERAVIAGLAPAQTGVDALVEEMAEHLRALLRDTLCGHLDSDLLGLADSLLSEAAVASV